MTSKLRLILTWNIRPGREQEYSMFVNDWLAPGVIELGLPSHDVYYTAYGDVPQIMVVLDVPDVAKLPGILNSRRWQELKKELFQYIEDYEERVVKVNGDGGFF
ncbi:MAG TPA: hypothetical protein EYP25_11120 [Anaerolineae bacterium]|nr:hypothetical protein [Anaerolineae bacterium]